MWDYLEGVSEVIAREARRKFFWRAMPTSGTNPTPLGGNPNPSHVA